MGRKRRPHGNNKGAKANESSNALQLSQDEDRPTEDEDPTVEDALTPTNPSKTVNNEEIVQQDDIQKGGGNDLSKPTHQLSKEKEGQGETSSSQKSPPGLDDENSTNEPTDLPINPSKPDDDIMPTNVSKTFDDKQNQQDDNDTGDATITNNHHLFLLQHVMVLEAISLQQHQLGAVRGSMTAV
jgi:hypothetical protein